MGRKCQTRLTFEGQLMLVGCDRWRRTAGGVVGLLWGIGVTLAMLVDLGKVLHLFVKGNFLAGSTFLPVTDDNKTWSHKCKWPAYNAQTRRQKNKTDVHKYILITKHTFRWWDSLLWILIAGYAYQFLVSCVIGASVLGVKDSKINASTYTADTCSLNGLMDRL